MRHAVFSSDLDPNGPTPLYLQVGHHISGLIGKDSRFMERLPSEAELCQMYGVSRITVRQALSYLAERDIVVRQHGRGTFVGALHRPGRQQTIHSFFEILAGKGLSPEMTLLDYRMRPPPEEVAEALSLTGDALFIRRGYRSEEGPLGVTEVFYPEQLAELVTPELASCTTSASILQDVLKLHISHADISIGLSRASQDVAEWLKVDTGAPLMRIKRVTTCIGQGVCEYSRLLVTEGTADFRINADGEMLTESMT
ncbi:GntR family transcriptional regulator [Gluconobacter oxydans]|uniref:GntR family transcriptional regulator n=1 Tax=Gluconobacter thailandicus TaxID=257438 RepID=UPI00030E6518|nr:GntR family transcriptional regulator [Gluconobacter thailandicus]ANQ42151.1 GntR family transcriptional regulator [Gluconobacter oxydans]GAN90256.1 transcriptional regulator GntR [Gluconobacter frateurii M-2]